MSENDHEKLQARVTRLMNQGRAADARAMLAPLLEDEEAPRQAFILMSRLLEKTDSRPEALAILVRAEERFGAFPALRARRAELHYRSGLVDEALAELREALVVMPRHREWRLQLARWCGERGHHDEAFTLLSAVAGTPPVSFLELRLWVAAGLRTGNFTKLAGRQRAVRIGAAGDAGRERVVLLALRAVGVILDADIPRGELTLSNVALDDCRQYAWALSFRGLAGEARAFTDSVRALGPRAAALSGTAFIVGFFGESLPEDRRHLLQLDASFVLDPRDLNQFADVLSLAGAPAEYHDYMLKSLELIDNLTDRARRAIDLVELLHGRNDGERARNLLTSIDFRQLERKSRLRIRRLYEVLLLPVPPELNIPGLIEPDEVFEEGVIRHYRFGHDRCVIWFGGVTPSGETSRQQTFLPVWKKLGVSVLTIHDQHRFASLSGFGRYFPDRPASEQALARLLAQLGYRQVLTSGASLAGASAFLYAVRLQAAGVLLFGGMTHLPKVEEIAANFGLLILHRLRNELSIDFDDALPLLAAHPNPDMVVHQHFGAHSAMDTRQANHIAHLPNVHLFAAPHDQHDALSWLRAHGQLEDAIGRFVAALPKPAFAQ